MKYKWLFFFLPALFFFSCYECQKKNNKIPGGSIKDSLITPLVSEVDTICYQPVGYEIPISVSNIPEQIIRRKSYILSFNKDTRCANWVAWYLSAEHTSGPVKRKQMDYLEDEETLIGKQLYSDWDSISSGYDHGHMCPAGDNKWDRRAMAETFYLSNMCVQQSSLNQETWERLETICRNWAAKFKGIFIICGPIFKTHPIRKTGNGLSVPDSFFKVVLCLHGVDGYPQAIGFVYKNTEPEKKEKFETHAVSIDEVEDLTGFDFFSKLPDNVENEIEATYDLKKWRR